jgi:hypothetical protein
VSFSNAADAFERGAAEHLLLVRERGVRRSTSEGGIGFGDQLRRVIDPRSQWHFDQ